MSKETKPLHKVSFQEQPIWFKANFIGKYNGINFRFSFSEYTNEDVDNVINSFSFKWPGRIPENKELAEEGIKKLFLIRRAENTLDYNVDSETDVEAIFEGELKEFDELVQAIEEHGDDD